MPLTWRRWPESAGRRQMLPGRLQGTGTSATSIVSHTTPAASLAVQSWAPEWEQDIRLVSWPLIQSTGTRM